MFSTIIGSSIFQYSCLQCIQQPNLPSWLTLPPPYEDSSKSTRVEVTQLLRAKRRHKSFECSLEYFDKVSQVSSQPYLQSQPTGAFKCKSSHLVIQSWHFDRAASDILGTSFILRCSMGLIRALLTPSNSYFIIPHLAEFIHRCIDNGRFLQAGMSCFASSSEYISF